MREIVLNKTKGPQGFLALVDDEDYEYVNQWNWSVKKGRHTYYAFRGKCKQYNYTTLHALIMQNNSARPIDHWDGNGLNCQKHNLRFCTQSQNSSNRIAGGASKYLGVDRDNRWDKKWRAKICTNYKRIHLGYYTTEEEAALAYNNAAIQYHGEFAKLNIINA